MSFWNKIKKIVQVVLRTAFCAPQKYTTPDKTYEGNTLDECEKKWERIDTISSGDWRDVRNIGVYRLRYVRNIGICRLRLGCIVYIGRVIYKQGFHWWMQQHDSGSSAGNTTPSAKKIHANRKNLEIEIIRMKSRKATKALEKVLISKYRPCWNSHSKG